MFIPYENYYRQWMMLVPDRIGRKLGITDGPNHLTVLKSVDITDACAAAPEEWFRVRILVDFADSSLGPVYIFGSRHADGREKTLVGGEICDLDNPQFCSPTYPFSAGIRSLALSLFRNQGFTLEHLCDMIRVADQL